MQAVENLPVSSALPQGLTEREVQERRAQGKGNDAALSTSRSYSDILRENVFTFVNNILFIIGIALLVVGRVGDAFVTTAVIIVNIIIGVIQEARAKRQLDRIALLTRPRVTVRRAGAERDVDQSEVVLGDIIHLRAGDQILVDGVVVGDGKMEVDESLLTGESDLIPKLAGDEVLSGSFVVTGSGYFEATRVGKDSFANKLTASARQFQQVKTPLQREVDFVIRILVLLASFFGILIFASTLVSSIPAVRSVQMAAVVAGIVPNGLIFMVTVAYALGALRMAGRNALIQRANAVESISNVTVLCLDKTGTLTANAINFHAMLTINSERAALETLLGDFAASTRAGNRTSEAVAAAFKGQPRRVIDEVPFSSALKWSGLVFDDSALRGVYVLGAPEMLWERLDIPADIDLKPQMDDWADKGLRVLLFAHQPAAQTLHDSLGLPGLPERLIPIAVLAFSDQLREGAQETLDGFRQAGIRLKIISGDNPHTVAALARQAGMTGEIKVVSGLELAQMDAGQISKVAEETTIFGRITPEQKEALVDALKQNGHYVAMIGDGVNDVLSLKKAHLGIAMQSGSAATRGVADIVLLNDSFGALPPAFLEGQRILSGMRDILRLFLTRAFYMGLIILSVSVVGVGFPFVPKHTSLISLLTVGLPVFALAAWARPEPAKGSMMRSMVHFVVPAALTVGLFGMLVYLLYFLPILTGLLQAPPPTPEQVEALSRIIGFPIDATTAVPYSLEFAQAVARTALTVFSMLCGLLLIVFVEPPTRFWVGGDVFSGDWRPTILAGLILVVFGVIMFVPPLRQFFELMPLQWFDYGIITGITLVWMFVLRFIWRRNLFERFLNLEVDAAA